MNLSGTILGTILTCKVQTTMFHLQNLTCRFGHTTALAVDDLTLQAGETVALIGPNGSGKTTLLRLVAGLINPTTGTIARNCSHVAYVAQHQHHHPWMPLTVGEVLKMGRYGHRGMLGRLNREDHTLISAAADRLEVADLQSRQFGELSGGQCQRVQIAAALAADAPCLLLDEPITGLDLPSQKIINQVAEEERDRGRLVVLSTHHLEEAKTCDRVLVLATRLVADGPPAEALQASALAAAFGARVVRVDDGADSTELALIDDHGHGHDHGHGEHHEHDHHGHGEHHENGAGAYPEPVLAGSPDGAVIDISEVTS